MMKKLAFAVQKKKKQSPQSKRIPFWNVLTKMSKNVITLMLHNSLLLKKRYAKRTLKKLVKSPSNNKPLIKNCNGQGEDICQTVYESACTTKYVEKQPGKFVGDTSCEKLPVEICGAGCVTEEGEEECHDKVITSLVDVPEEVCDLNPQKTCRFVTKLVPSLSPEHQCTIVPKETCTLKFTQPKQVPKPLQTRWCLDPTEPAPGESYDESNALENPWVLLRVGWLPRLSKLLPPTHPLLLNM